MALQLRTTLKDICLKAFSGMCTQACIAITDKKLFQQVSSNELSKTEKEIEVIVQNLPGRLLENILAIVLKNLETLNENTRVQVAINSLKLLLQNSVQSLFVGSGYSSVSVDDDFYPYEEELVACQYGIQKLKFVTHLTLEFLCTDGILYELARHCGSLKVFQTSSKFVSDQGLIALGGVETIVNLAPNRGCLALTELSVEDCSISTGATFVILKKLTELKDLGCFHQFAALQTLFAVDEEFCSGRKKLKLVHFDQTKVDQSVSCAIILQNIQNLLPNLCSMKLCLNEESYRGLFVHLRNLKELNLQIDNLDDQHFFKFAIYKRTCLVKLSLECVGLPCLDLIAITRQCPLLEMLYLYAYGIPDMNTCIDLKSPGVLKTLKILKICFVQYQDTFEGNPNYVCQELIKFLVKACPNMTELEFNAREDFIDHNLMSELSQANAMPHVSSLTLNIEDGLRENGIEYAFSMKNLLASCLPELKQLFLLRSHRQDKSDTDLSFSFM